MQLSIESHIIYDVKQDTYFLHLMIIMSSVVGRILLPLPLLSFPPSLFPILNLSPSPKPPSHLLPHPFLSIPLTNKPALKSSRRKTHISFVAANTKNLDLPPSIACIRSLSRAHPPLITCRHSGACLFIKIAARGLSSLPRIGFVMRRPHS